MKSILFICPYFGTLPESQMKIWMNSCKYNPSIDWIIFTDDKKTELPIVDNVKIKYIDFNEVKQLIQSKFDFQINIDNPYKLCDFKPAYGYIFQEYTKGYDYWGHCDMTDSIFGNLRNFLTDDFLQSADKLLYLGHMTLYKNSKELYKYFLNELPDINFSPKKIFGSSQHFAFDELPPYGINAIYKYLDIPISRQDTMYVDINDLHGDLRYYKVDNNFKRYQEISTPRIFEWINGSLFDIYIENEQLKKREIGYLHYQKRFFKYFLKEFDHFYITPNKFINYNKELTTHSFQKLSKGPLLYTKGIVLRYKNLKKKLQLIKNKL